MSEKEFVEYILSQIQDDNTKIRIEHFFSLSIMKAADNKKKYILCNIAVIIINGIIPVMTLFQTVTAISIVIAFLSFIASTLMSIIVFMEWNKKTLRYRKYTELLKHESYLYCAKLEKYLDLEDSERNRLFSEAIENIIFAENLAWEDEFIKKYFSS